MTFNELMMDYLAKTLGKSNESITDLLYKKADDGTPTDELTETALSSLEDLHASHVSVAPSDALKAEHDKGHQAGKFEALSKMEETIRKKYGIESKAQGTNLIDEVIAKITKAETSEDKILTHPLYLSALAEKDTALENVRNEYESKFTEIKTESERKQRFSSNLPKIEAAIKDAGAVLPSSPAAASNLMAAFLGEFSQYDFDEQETGTYLKDESGKLVKDKHGHPVTVESYTKAKASEWFDIQKQPPVKSPGNTPDAPIKPTKDWTKDNLPKTIDEFNTAYYELKKTDHAAASELAKAYEAAAQQ